MGDYAIGIILLLLALLFGFISIAAFLGVLVSKQKTQIKAYKKKAQNTVPQREQVVDTDKRILNTSDLETKKIAEITASDANKATVYDGIKTNIPVFPPLHIDGDIEVTPEFLKAIELFESDFPCVYVTGKAGTGKSTLLRYFIERTKKPAVLLTPTGMAALRIGGQTIHSFFGFPGRTLTDEDIKPSRKGELYRAIQTIVIDEISMVRADMLDRIDQFLRLNGRDASKPFGGAQMILFGDLYQLPPIVSEEEESQYISVNYSSAYFFDAHVMKEVPFRMLELSKVFRQKDMEFINALDAIRINAVDQGVLQLINQRCIPPQINKKDGFITLTATNSVADQINRIELEKLASEKYTYAGILEGEFNSSGRRKSLPADYLLDLKTGAQIIFVKNDANKRFLNGDLGRILDLAPNLIHVEMVRDGKRFPFDLQQDSWEIIKYEFDYGLRKITPITVGKYTQYPIRLGWAITIHKSQGATLEGVHINMGQGAFTTGQTYVALSRCVSLQGITLERPISPADIKSDGKIKRFMDTASRNAIKQKNSEATSDISHQKDILNNYKPGKDMGILLKIDEEQKFGRATQSGNNWWVSESTDMLVPILGNGNHVFNLRKLRGSCRVYINGRISWIADISDMMSAQALWKELQRYQDAYIELEVIKHY